MALETIIFSELCSYLDYKEFMKCVKKYNGDYKVISYTCYCHLLVMIFAQLTNRDSLRDIENSLMSQINKLYHMGFGKCKIISRDVIAKANCNRDYRIYEDYATILIEVCKKLYLNDNSNNNSNELLNELSFNKNFDRDIYALDSSIIRVAFSLMPWAEYMDNSKKNTNNNGAVKLHTLLDIKGSIPTVNIVTNGNVYDANIIDELLNKKQLSKDDLVIMDRGYMKYLKLFLLEQSNIFFICRAIKRNLKFRRIYSNKTNKLSKQDMIKQELDGRVIYDQIAKFTTKQAKKDYPNKIRIIKYESNQLSKYNEEGEEKEIKEVREKREGETEEGIKMKKEMEKEMEKEKKERGIKRQIKQEDKDGIMIFLTNNLNVSAEDIVKLYKERWNIECFFKWLKQNLKIKHFYSNTKNGVKIQIYTSIITYLLVCILRKKLNLEKYTIHEILQILSINVFERSKINQLFKNLDYKNLEKSYEFENDLLNLLG